MMKEIVDPEWKGTEIIPSGILFSTNDLALNQDFLLEIIISFFWYEKIAFNSNNLELTVGLTLS